MAAFPRRSYANLSRGVGWVVGSRANLHQLLLFTRWKARVANIHRGDRMKSVARTRGRVPRVICICWEREIRRERERKEGSLIVRLDLESISRIFPNKILLFKRLVLWTVKITFVQKRCKFGGESRSRDKFTFFRCSIFGRKKEGGRRKADNGANSILLLRINFTMLSVCRGKVSKREAISGSSSSLLGKQRFIRRKLHVLPRFDTLVVRPDHHLNPRIRDEKARDDTRETDRRCRYVSFLARIKPCHLSIRSHHSKWKSNCMEKGSCCCCCCCENFLRSNSFDGRGEDKLERKIKLLGSKLIHLGIMQMQIILLPSFLFSTILFYFKIELWQTYNSVFSRIQKTFKLS